MSVNAAAAQRILAESFVREVEIHRELPSTNDLAMQLAGRPELPTPLLVLAEHQTAGRGRGANQWWGSPGALTFSLVLAAEPARLPQHLWPLVSLTAGLAVCTAVQQLCPEIQPGLKWPNDVYIQRRKACGILVEIPPASTQRIVVGIGLNVNNSLHAAPAGLAETAVSLVELTGRQIPLIDVLIALLEALRSRVAQLGTDRLELVEQWQSRCLLTGRTVQVQTGHQTTVGRCTGIDADGCLILQNAAGPQRCLAGVVSILD